MESEPTMFEYLDLVVLKELGDEIYMIQDYYYSASGTEYELSSVNGQTRRVASDEIRKVGHIDWPIAFGSAVRPTHEFEERIRTGFTRSKIVGMTYNYKAATWHYAISLDDGTVIMADSDNFEIIAPL